MQSGKKENFSSSSISHSKELAVPLSEPQFPYLQGSHEKGFIKELELGTGSASQARH